MARATALVRSSCCLDIAFMLACEAQESAAEEIYAAKLEEIAEGARNRRWSGDFCAKFDAGIGDSFARRKPFEQHAKEKARAMIGEAYRLKLLAERAEVESSAPDATEMA